MENQADEDVTSTLRKSVNIKSVDSEATVHIESTDTLVITTPSVMIEVGPGGGLTIAAIEEESLKTSVKIKSEDSKEAVCMEFTDSIRVIAPTVTVEAGPSRVNVFTNEETAQNPEGAYNYQSRKTFHIGGIDVNFTGVDFKMNLQGITVSGNQLHMDPKVITDTNDGARIPIGAIDEIDSNTGKTPESDPSSFGTNAGEIVNTGSDTSTEIYMEEVETMNVGPNTSIITKTGEIVITNTNMEYEIGTVHTVDTSPNTSIGTIMGEILLKVPCKKIVVGRIRTVNMAPNSKIVAVTEETVNMGPNCKIGINLGATVHMGPNCEIETNLKGTVHMGSNCTIGTIRGGIVYMGPDCKFGSKTRGTVHSYEVNENPKRAKNISTAECKTAIGKYILNIFGKFRNANWDLKKTD